MCGFQESLGVQFFGRVSGSSLRAKQTAVAYGEDGTVRQHVRATLQKGRGTCVNLTCLCLMTWSLTSLQMLAAAEAEAAEAEAVAARLSIH